MVCVEMFNNQAIGQLVKLDSGDAATTFWEWPLPIPARPICPAVPEMYLSHPHFSLLAFPHNCVTYDPNIVWLSAEIKCKYQLRFGFWWCRNHSLGVAFANPSNLSARPLDVLVWSVGSAQYSKPSHPYCAQQPHQADQTFCNPNLLQENKLQFWFTTCRPP